MSEYSFEEHVMELQAEWYNGFEEGRSYALQAQERLREVEAQRDALLAACQVLVNEHDRCFQDREHRRKEYYAAHPFREIAYNKARAAIARAKAAP